MRKVQHIILYVFAVLVIGCGGHENGRIPQPSDTLYTAEAAMNIYAYEPERALTIIDTALIVGNIDEDVAKLLRAKVYGQTLVEPRMDTAQQMLLELLKSNYTKDLHNREVVLDLLYTIARNKSQIELQLHWSTLKADCCREQGHETEALRTEAEIGYLLAQLGEEEKGLHKLNVVIASLDGQRQVDEMDACIIAIKRKINLLRQLGRQEEVIPLAQHITEIVNDFRENNDKYIYNSYRLPKTTDQTERYCQFFTSQAQGFLVNAYAELGALDSARYYLSLFEQSDYGNTPGVRSMIAPALCLLGDYSKMLAIYDELEKQMGDDTINSEYAVMLRGRAIAAQAEGNSRQATGYWKRYAELNNQVNKQLQQGQAYEYAARYHLQEERLNTERERAVSRRISIIAIFLGVIVLIVVVFIILLIRQLNYIRKKNTVLSNEIAERIEYEEKYHSMVDKLNVAVQADGVPDKMRNSDESGFNNSTVQQFNISTISTLSDSQLYEFLRHVIQEEKLYVDPACDRQMLQDRFQLSKERLGAAFAHGSRYGTLKNFLNETRLQHSAKLLVENPEMSINEVATSSGYASYVVFSRNFKQRFTLTPTEFREQKDTPVQ